MMSELFSVKYPVECKTLPEGFWSAIDVWIKKPHVVNKRLCGAKETESQDVDTEGLGRLLSPPGSVHSHDIQSFLTGGPSSALIDDKQKVWSYTVRTLIPKGNCCGPNVYKEVLLKDFDRQRVTFIPFEEDEEGKRSQKTTNVYQIQLLHQDCEEWSVELRVLRPQEWFSDGVVYPKPAWYSTYLLPKLVRWATETKTSEFKATLSLLPVEKYSAVYQQLKTKYKEMVKVWPEVTDPEKFVYEDVAIATYLLVLWTEERAELGLTEKQSFVDLGCGNGLLVHILANEGHPGKGIDVRRRKIWDMYGPPTLLEEQAITPGEGFLFPDTDWLIGNHSDELTPWIPVMAARSSYSCRYFVLPCCFFDFFGKYQRRQCKKSQYKEYIDFISEVSVASGFRTEEDCLRIPSTKRVCLVGKSRNYEALEEKKAEEKRSRYIQSRSACSPVGGHRTDGEEKGDGSRHDNTDTDGSPGSHWGAGFQPREKVETARNCAALPRDFVDGVVLRVATTLLGLTAGHDGEAPSAWNPGGSLSVREVAELLERDTLALLKKECGGLQTLLKNNHQVFRVEAGRVHIRDWKAESRVPAGRAAAKRRPLAPGAVKTRACWFHAHHPQGCPLQVEDCAFAHGPADLRPSTQPLKKMKNSAF